MTVTKYNYKETRIKEKERGREREREREREKERKQTRENKTSEDPTGMRKLHEAIKNKAAKAKNCLRIRKKAKQELEKDRKRKAGFKIVRWSIPQ